MTTINHLRVMTAVINIMTTEAHGVNEERMASLSSGWLCFGLRTLAIALLCIITAPSFGGKKPVEGFNEWCPVTTVEPAKIKHHADYQGVRIYFCCQRCRGKFERNPSAYPTALAIVEQKHTTGSSDKYVREDQHQHDHAVRSALPAPLRWLGKLHPSVVHFPIALLSVAAGAELLRLRFNQKLLAEGAYFCLWVGCISALIAALLGWLYGGIQLQDGDWLMTTHRWLGTTVAVWSLLLLSAGVKRRRKGDQPRFDSYLVLILVGAMLVVATGFIGGSLIHGLDHLSWR